VICHSKGRPGNVFRGLISFLQEAEATYQSYICHELISGAILQTETTPFYNSWLMEWETQPNRFEKACPSSFLWLMRHGQAPTLLVKGRAKQLCNHTKQELVPEKRREGPEKEFTTDPAGSWTLLPLLKRSRGCIFFHCQLSLQSMPSPLL
jgi:hypothetical protein